LVFEMDHVFVERFVENGVVVVPSVLSETEIGEVLSELEAYLLKNGCDPKNLAGTAGELAKLSSTNGSGGVLDVFYEGWKLKLNEHPKIVEILQSLWANSYAPYREEDSDSLFSHPFGEFDPTQGFMYIDRVCYRVPSAVSASFGPTKRKQLQRSLTPHLDCCPHDMYGKGSKWRPIQAFLCLTDTMEPEQGGFEACLGHHKNFTEWASNRPGSALPPPGGVDPVAGGAGATTATTAPCLGDFTPIRPGLDQDVLDKMQSIPCRAGDLVCWVSEH
jgi:hypothetical protein